MSPPDNGGGALVNLRDQRIVVTGGAGFLGRAVVEALYDQGCFLVFVPRTASYDLVEKDAVADLFSDYRPDLVIHLAARVGGIGANRDNPGLFFHDNLVMGVNVLEQGRRLGVAKIVIAGTICAYPKFAPVPFREEDLWNGYPEETNAPYGIAKKALLVMSEAYRAQYGLNSSVVFPVNLYGPRDNFDLDTSHVIPALVRKIDEAMRQDRDVVVLWGDGSPTREFLYVDDAANGILRACEVYNSSEPVNLGVGHEISIRALAEKIARLMGFTGTFAWDTTKPNGQPRRALDTSRARERLGWQAKVGLDEGLERTIAWWRGHGAHESQGHEPRASTGLNESELRELERTGV